LQGKIDPAELSKHGNAERILQVGWELFHKRGYRGVSVDEICQQCHLTKPTLYYYFQNKENLYVQVLLYRMRDLRHAIEEQGTLPIRLKRFLHVMLETATPNLPVMVRDMENISDPAYHKLIAEAFQTEFLQPLTALMQTGIDSGELAPNDPVFYAWLFLGMMSPFVAHSIRSEIDSPMSRAFKHRPLWAATRSHGPQIDLPDIIDTLVEIFLKGARP